MGMWGTYMPVGMALSMVIATWTLGSIGWRGLWFVNAGIVLLFVFVFAWGASSRRWHSPAMTGAAFDGDGVRATLARPGLWLFGACFVLFSIQWLALMAWLPTFMIETQGHSLTEAARLAALVVLSTAVGSVAGGWLMHRRVARWLLIGIAYVVMGVCGALVFAPFVPADIKIPLATAFALVGGMLPAACLAGAGRMRPARPRSRWRAASWSRAPHSAACSAHRCLPP